MTTTKYRKDYQPPSHFIDEVILDFDLHPTQTQVQSKMTIRKNPNSKDKGILKLDGQDLKLVEIHINDTPVSPSEYTVHDSGLELTCELQSFVLSIKTEISPQTNTSLSGLYLSSGNFCTQCEAQGFRKITYFLDRPDVLAKYTVNLTADAKNFPVLLSNGNPTHSEPLANGKHRATWVDPYPKPSYLFALVAGNLSKCEGQFTTKSGRNVLLQIFVLEQYLDQCDYALQSLKDAMKWDEERFGLEYDLDVYMIVAVDDFNMGAMENKGLNIFNTKYVLANDVTGTDQDFDGIQSVVGHEYFHNWTGNRVTCRDWFQLSLKEGLTVFRDQEFSADLGDRTVKRIEDVRVLKEQQFPEDAGPMAHPIRPDSYVQIDNFYTATVYEKGSEVIRMIHTLIGEDNFQKGMSLYFKRHDGKAVTCEDFIVAMEDASNTSLLKFRAWYEQAGTPTLKINSSYDEQKGELRLDCSQTSGSKENGAKPFSIPLRLGFVSEDGKPLEFSLPDQEATHESVLVITDETQTFTCSGFSSRPIPSLNRDFSAPVQLIEEQSTHDLAVLMQFDPNLYNRWDAGQKLAQKVILNTYNQTEDETTKQRFAEGFTQLCNDNTLPPAIKALMLELPSIQSCLEHVPVFDVEHMASARGTVLKELSRDNLAHLMELFIAPQPKSGRASADARKLGNTALALLTYCKKDSWLKSAEKHYKTAKNMTDRLAAFQAIMTEPSDVRTETIQDFYSNWKDYPLLVNKWFAIQSASRSEDAFKQVKELETHPAFQTKNPNNVRALYGAFAMRNLRHFHKADGSGYRFIESAIKAIDPINPQVASSLTKSFRSINSINKANQKLMKESLSSIQQSSGLSKNTLEISTRFIEACPT